MKYLLFQYDIIYKSMTMHTRSKRWFFFKNRFKNWFYFKKHSIYIYIYIYIYIHIHI